MEKRKQMIHFGRSTAAFLIAALLLLSSGARGRALEPVREPELSAGCAVLMDGASGRVLYAKNSEEERPIASITKIMTALVSVERADLNDKVPILKEYTLVEGSSIYLKQGEVVTMEELLYGLLLESGNDAAAAVAGHVGGNTESFVKLMNEKAAALGLSHTHFTNPSGLSQDGHYSSALDMANITRAALENDTFFKIFSTKAITIGSRSLKNHNRMMWDYPGTIGGKTGFTKLAGRTLVTCAKRDTQWLIAVTLHAPNDWADQSALFDYGFSVFPETRLCNEGDEICCIPVTNGISDSTALRPKENLSYPLKKGESVKTVLDLPESAKAPVKAGRTAGTLTYLLDGKVIGKTELVYAENIEKISFWDRISIVLDNQNK